MSILIEGMKMPKDGFITITVTSDGRVVGNSKKENGKFEYLDNEDIAKAVPVPPHGRLIDADVLKSHKISTEEWFGCQCSTITVDVVFKTDVENAPTIITAEEGE